MISWQSDFLLGAQVVDRRLDDRPVVADPLPQRMVEREADDLALFGCDRLVKTSDGGLGGRVGVGPACAGPAAAAVLPIKRNGPGERAGADRLDKVASRDGRAD